MKRCEAMVEMTYLQGSHTWSRCFAAPADLHHRLTRARGGLILDQAGETYHLMYLCRRHHAMAHDQGSAFERGLLIDGYVTTGPHGPVYEGSDPYLSSRYGPDVRVPGLQGEEGRPQPRSFLRRQARS